MINIKIWFDHHHGNLYIQNLSDNKTEKLTSELHIKKFLLAHGLKKQNLKAPVETLDVTGLFAKKNIFLGFLRGKNSD